MISLKIGAISTAAFIACIFVAPPFLVFGSTISSGLSMVDASVTLDVAEGDEVIVQSTLEGNSLNPQEFVFIVQVEDELGRVVFLGYKADMTAPSIEEVVSVSWHPDENATYIVKTFVWSNLNNPVPANSLMRELRIDVDGETKLRCTGSALCFTGVITEIVDGDTFDVNNIRIRLSLVDSPELSEPGYGDASEFTSEICHVGSRVVVDQDDGQLVDAFGRMLAKVTCEGNLVLNAELLESGHADVLTEYCGESEFSTESWVVEGCMVVSVPPGETPIPLLEPPPEEPPEEENCHPSYPDVCIPAPPPDLDCEDISFKNFRVVGSDPHRFDGNKDGVGCEE